MSDKVSQEIGIFDSPQESILDSLPLRDFIRNNATADPVALRLKESGRQHGFDLDFALIQIGARQKCSRKLSRFLSNPGFLFSSDLASQQATHQDVADFHASLIGSGRNILDMTAGQGIDSLTFSEHGNRVTSLEIDSWKCDVLRHNAEALGLPLDVVCADSTEYLLEETEPGSFDWVYADPARRGAEDLRLYGLTDCFPNLVPLAQELLERARNVMIKGSPLLDIRQTLRDLPGIRRIIAVSWHGECKELLIIMNKEQISSPKEDAKETPGTVVLQAVNITPRGIESFETGGQEPAEPPAHPLFTEEDMERALREEELWLYEPNASVMKLACWNDLLIRFPQLRKAGPNTHLFLSKERLAGFPGRIVRIDMRVSRKEFKSLKGTRMTVVSRNFPEEAASLRKRLGVKEGDESFLYAFRLGGIPVMLLGHAREESRQDTPASSANKQKHTL